MACSVPATSSSSAGDSRPPRRARLSERADVTRPADRGVRMLLDQPRGLIGLVLEQPDMDGVAERQMASASSRDGRKRRARRQSLGDGRELQRPQAGGIRIRRARGAGHRR